MEILALIPARGGSKGIPHKNIVDVAGKPLIAWTIKAAKQSKYITRVVVSSDDDAILSVAEEYGAEKLKRPAEYATDTAPYQPLVLHALDMLQNGGYEPDYLVYLQPTSPLRDQHDVDAAFDVFLKHSDADGLISVSEIDNKILKAFLVNENGYLVGITNNEFPFMNRQDLPTVFMPNGAIYIVRPDVFRKNNELFSEKIVPFPMSVEKSVDIDTADDLQKINSLLKA